VVLLAAKITPSYFLKNNDHWGNNQLLETFTILITGAGSPGAPGVIKSLRSVNGQKLKIIGMDIVSDVASKAMLDKFFVGPKAIDSNFIEECLKLCTAEKVDVILPMVSLELPLFSKHRQQFKRIGTDVSVSDLQPLLLAMNKSTLIQMLKQSGISIPRSITVHNVDELRQAIYRLGYPDQTVCMKPTVSDGSRGFRILDSKKNRLDLLFYEKPNSVYISETELFDILKSTSDIPETIVMEYLPYEEYSVDLLAKHGEVTIAIPRLREKIVDGISVKSVIVKEDDVIEYASCIVNKLGLHGNIGVQVRRDNLHQPKIIEINPRIQGTIVHCTAAGVNLPYLAIKLAKGIPISRDELTIQWGTRMTRYWDEVYFDGEGLSINLI
jgi:carbamoyl-phosphate synthase large subunit